jgi:hypothetical protein
LDFPEEQILALANQNNISLLNATPQRAIRTSFNILSIGLK